ncbi:hypothetical protein NDU88_003517 [Pleurodeles waltl]|uniref:Uncharacterized protein n=1 Tax=Pleurodeles waltl TaxID=8319 RepID=A0AAV7W2F4_PLEWA|nr:hypothetical protein NDU88_003517 [Pleurodeles waltl]
MFLASPRCPTVRLGLRPRGRHIKKRSHSASVSNVHQPEKLEANGCGATQPSCPPETLKQLIRIYQE